MPPLCGIISSDLSLDDDITLYSPIFDPYDHWTQIDKRLNMYAKEVFTYPQAIGTDILHMSIFAHYLLFSIDKIRSDHTSAQELADLQAFVEAFLTSSRSLCDGIAAYLSKICLPKKGQAPPTLRKLITWVKKNPHKVLNPDLETLLAKIDWFEEIRKIRDAIMHFGGYPWIITNSQDFRMVIHAPYNDAAITDVDLSIFLHKTTRYLLDFMDESGTLINLALKLPNDRHQSRKLLGLRLASLARLRKGPS